VKGTVEMIRIPEIATEAKRKVVMPPKTAEGIEVKAAANLENNPMMIRNKHAA
jgi:hypothetical protein